MAVNAMMTLRNVNQGKLNIDAFNLLLMPEDYLSANFEFRLNWSGAFYQDVQDLS